MSDTAVRDFKKDNAEIVAIADGLKGRNIEGLDELVRTALVEQKTPDEFRSAVLAKLPQAKPLEKSILHDVPVRDWKHYSISRAICGQMSGRMDGFEGEINQEIAKRTGQSATGFWLPAEAMARNAIAGTGTLGGMVVSTPNLGSEFIELLRAKTVAGQMGARMLQLPNPVTIPRQSGATTANWVNGETAAATLSGVNFTQLTLTPKVVSAVNQYSKQLLATSNPSIDSILRDDITQVIALAIDKAVLHGTGATGEPTGITATTGIATVALGQNGAALSTANAYPAFVSMETEVATDHADTGSLGYVINAVTRGKLKTIGKTGTDSVFVWEPGNTINGYKVGISNQILTNLTKGTATTLATAAFYGNWNDLLIAEFNGGATDLVVDPYSLSLYGVVRLVARKWLDLGVRHPESFSVILDILN